MCIVCAQTWKELLLVVEVPINMQNRDTDMMQVANFLYQPQNCAKCLTAVTEICSDFFLF